MTREDLIKAAALAHATEKHPDFEKIHTGYSGFIPYSESELHDKAQDNFEAGSK